MRQRYIFLISFLTLFPFAVPTHAQDCTGPDGDIGVLRYNVDYGVLQVCTPKDWIAVHGQTCPDGDGSANPCSFEGSCSTPSPGTECTDGSFYIGDSPEDGAPVFMTSAAHEGSEIRWDNADCYHCGDGTIATSQTDGRANTNALLAFNATGFDAIAHCESLNAIEAHGYDDWYLPAGGTGVGVTSVKVV